MSIFASQAAVIVQNTRLYENAINDAQQLEALINGASDGIVIVDDRGEIVRFNRAMREMTGLLTETLIGMDCDEVLPSGMQRADDPHGEGALLLKEVLRTGRHIPFSESAVENTDGERVDLAVSYSYIGGADGSAPMAAAIVRDVSDIREVERMKSDFVSMVSHELRTPLALIKGYVATLLRAELSLDDDTVRRFQQGNQRCLGPAGPDCEQSAEHVPDRVGPDAAEPSGDRVEAAGGAGGGRLAGQRPGKA